jgi:hypothetical protein
MAMGQEKNDGGPQTPSSGESPAIAPAAEYIKATRAHLWSGRQKQAYSILLKASSAYPGHPIILSYCGWLQAVVDKKHQSGIASCRKAFVNFKTANPDTARIIYPLLYLNLGRTLLIAGKKKEAVESFVKGLHYDQGHSEIKKEMKSLGIRKEPFLPFLSRSNPLNKYVGKLLHAKRTTVRFR